MTKITVTRSPHTVFKSRPVDSTTLSSGQKVEVQHGQSFQVQTLRQEGNHYFVRLAQPIPPVGQVGYFFVPHVQIDRQEIHGVWLTNIDSEVLFSLDNIKAALTTLRELGFNTLYPTVWQGGYTLYPSAIAEPLVGAKIHPEPRLQGRDMLAELVTEGHNQGFRVIPWFEFGLMTPTDSDLAQNHPELLTQTIDGNRASDALGCAWLNPVHPTVQEFIVNLIADVVERYDVDGIQLDDHFGLHVKQGYDDLTKNLYRNEKGTNPPANETDAAWVSWRAGKITDLLQQIFNEVKAQRRDQATGRECCLSISPGGAQSFSYTQYLADWQRWERSGFIEELVPQFYRTTRSAFSAEARKPEVIVARDHIPTLLGIGASIDGQPMSFDLIRQQVEETRSQRFAGMSFFFYESLWNLRPATETKGDRQEAFKQLLNLI